MREERNLSRCLGGRGDGGCPSLTGNQEKSNVERFLINCLSRIIFKKIKKLKNITNKKYWAQLSKATDKEKAYWKGGLKGG